MKVFKVYVDEKVCKGCELCVFYCPKKVLHLSGRYNFKGYNIAEAMNDNCIGCQLCVIGCPDLAIYVEEVKNAG